MYSVWKHSQYMGLRGKLRNSNRKQQRTDQLPGGFTDMHFVWKHSQYLGAERGVAELKSRKQQRTEKTPGGFADVHFRLEILPVHGVLEGSCGTLIGGMFL